MILNNVLCTFQLSKQTPHHIKQTEQMPINLDLSQIRKICVETERQLPASTKSNIMNVIPAPV